MAYRYPGRNREGIRVVIELKRETQPQVVLDNLYRQTPLQTNFGAILLALVDGQPQQMSLKELLQQFLNFREQTLIRRYTPGGTASKSVTPARGVAERPGAPRSGD